MEQDRLLANARRVLETESAAVAAVASQLDDRLSAVARLLLDCTGKVLVAGVGTSHATALRMAHLLSCCGTPALFIHPGDAMHGTSGAVAEGDVLVAISKGGETDEVNRLAAIARERGARVVSITESDASTLAQLSDLALVVRAPADVDPYGMIATGSSLVYSAVSDVICVTMLELRQYSKEAFARTHPGGAVGKKIRAEEGGEEK